MDGEVYRPQSEGDRPRRSTACKRTISDYLAPRGRRVASRRGARRRFPRDGNVAIASNYDFNERKKIVKRLAALRTELTTVRHGVDPSWYRAEGIRRGRRADAPSDKKALGACEGIDRETRRTWLITTGAPDFRWEIPPTFNFRR